MNNPSFKELDSIHASFKEFLSFIKKPNLEQYSDRSSAALLKALLYMVLIDAVLMIAIMPLLSLIEVLGLQNADSHAMNDMLDKSVFFVITFGVVMAPILEEFIFRAILRFNKYVFNVLVALLGVSIVAYAFTVMQFVPAAVISTILLMASIYFTLKNTRLTNQLAQYWQNSFSVIFYVSCFLFGLVHLTNFQFEYSLFYLFPLLILPQFAIGMLLGFVRIKLGLGYCILLHAIHNGVLLTFALLFKDQLM